MTRIVGCCRFTWNRLLEYCGKSYGRRKESHTAFDLNNFIAHTLKPAYPWLTDAPAQTLQCVSADLSKMSQMTGFRSDDGGRDMCVGLSVVETLKANKADVYATMQEIFARAPHKRRKKVSSQLE